MDDRDIGAWLGFIDALDLDEDAATRLFCLPVVARGCLGLAQTAIAHAKAAQALGTLIPQDRIEGEPDRSSDPGERSSTGTGCNPV
jgi:hypothetical protein